MALNERIRQVRENSKLSQEAFGEKVGITRSSVSLLESGKNNPSEQTVRLICREFGVSYAWLKNGVGEMREAPSDIQTLDAIERILQGENEFVKFLFRKATTLDKSVWDKIEADLSDYFLETK